MFIEWIDGLVQQKLRHNAASFGEAENPEPEPLRTARTVKTILLVDDEPALLEVLYDRLSAEGYRVLTAESGEAAIHLCREHDGTIDILVSDVRMRTDGFKIAAAARSLHPHIFIVLMSGTPIDFSRLDTSSHFLSKPFPHEALLATISGTHIPLIERLDP